MSGMDEYYTILGVTKKATADEIKTAFNSLLLKYRGLEDADAQKNVKAIVDAYEHLQKCEVILRPDNTLDMVYDKNGIIQQFNATGEVVIELIDRKGNKKQFDDKGNPTRYRMKNGEAVDFYPNSDKILRHKDKFGNLTFYRPDTKVNMYYDAKGKIQKIYHEDGKTLKSTISDKGDITHYWPDGKHIFSIKTAKGTTFYAQDKFKETSFVDNIGNEVVYRSDKPNKVVAMKKFANGAVIEYDENGKTPRMIIDEYGRTEEHLSNGVTEYRRRDGGLMWTKDKKGNVNIYNIGTPETLFFSRSSDGLETFYQEDGIHPLQTKDKYGNETHFYPCSDNKMWTKDKYGNLKYYQDDGETLMAERDSKGNEVYYRQNGKTPAYKVDNELNYTFFFENGKTPMMTCDKNKNKIFYRMNGKDVLRKEDINGNSIHFARGDNKKLFEEDADGNKIVYRADGETKWYTADSYGNKRYFKDDGVTPDYDIIDGKKIPYKAPKAPSKPKRLIRTSRLALKRMMQAVH